MACILSIRSYWGNMEYINFVIRDEWMYETALQTIEGWLWEDLYGMLISDESLTEEGEEKIVAVNFAEFLKDELYENGVICDYLISNDQLIDI